MLGKSDHQELTDDDVACHSSLSGSDELCSGDCCNHRLLSRKTRLV